MDQKMKALFDFQRFQQNAKLEGIINDAESRYGDALDDADLELVNAAGTATVPTVHVEVLLSRHDTSANGE